MKNIWYFSGLLLLLTGLVIFISGIYYYNQIATTVLAHLHPSLWWGGIMLIFGGTMFYVNKNKLVE